jgi:hypothetical protein
MAMNGHLLKPWTGDVTPSRAAYRAIIPEALIHYQLRSKVKYRIIFETNLNFENIYSG